MIKSELAHLFAGVGSTCECIPRPTANDIQGGFRAALLLS
jgi:hypothetical protein